jgi:hypothetical protein
MNGNVGNGHADFNSSNYTNENNTGSDTNAPLPPYGQLSFDGPMYETREELVQVQSKDKYLSTDRDL